MEKLWSGAIVEDKLSYFGELNLSVETGRRGNENAKMQHV
jgi:hypothetical protein